MAPTYTRKQFFRYAVLQTRRWILDFFPPPANDDRGSKPVPIDGDTEGLYAAAIRRGIDPATLSRDALRETLEALEDSTQ